MPRVVVIGSLILLAVAARCNSKGLVPVEGRVTFAGKQPPAIGYLYFVPREMTIDKKEDRTGPLPGTARFGTDGSYRGTTFTDGDGLRPGTYEVRIICEAAPAAVNLPPEKSHGLHGKSLVPEGFKPADLVVPATGPRPVRYDLDVSRS